MIFHLGARGAVEMIFRCVMLFMSMSSLDPRYAQITVGLVRTFFNTELSNALPMKAAFRVVQRGHRMHSCIAVIG